MIEIPENSNIVILTGAGISAESGLNTFRGSDGLWEGHKIEDVATPEAFKRNPALVQQFYNERRSGLLNPDVQPNDAHKALAKLEQEWPKTNGGSVTLVTQNIDDLHERGGSQNVIHMHGELLKMFCTHCMKTDGKTNETAHKYEITGHLDVNAICPECGNAGTLRPDIVWFGEMPYHMDKIEDKLMHCDLFVSIGTSGNVYPAAGFVNLAKYAGAQNAEINLEPSINANIFNHSDYGPASKTVPQFVEKLISSYL